MEDSRASRSRIIRSDHVRSYADPKHVDLQQTSFFPSTALVFSPNALYSAHDLPFTVCTMSILAWLANPVIFNLVRSDALST